jgi:hypothetical protein
MGGVREAAWRHLEAEEAETHRVPGGWILRAFGFLSQTSEAAKAAKKFKRRLGVSPDSGR